MEWNGRSIIYYLGGGVQNSEALTYVSLRTETQRVLLPATRTNTLACVRKEKTSIFLFFVSYIIYKEMKNQKTLFFLFRPI